MKAEMVMAVAKAIKDKSAKEARDQLTPGTYEVSGAVRLTGTLTVGEDTEKVSTSSIISEDTLILALKMAGCTRDRAFEIIRNVASETIGLCVKEAKDVRQEMVAKYDPDGKISNLFDELKQALPRTQVRGQVRFNGTVEELQ